MERQYFHAFIRVVSLKLDRRVGYAHRSQYFHAFIRVVSLKQRT